MKDKEIGIVSLHSAARLVFSTSYWKGRNYAHIRKFVETARYNGPTKAGIALTGEGIINLISVLNLLQSEVPGLGDREFARFCKSEAREVVVSIKPPEDLNSLPIVDVREYCDFPSYKGPTKKGFRFSWDKLPEVLTLLFLQAEKLKVDEEEPASPSGQLKLFPEIKPDWVARVENETKEPNKALTDNILTLLIPNGPRDFPADFLTTPNSHVEIVELPLDPLDVGQLPDGKFVVRSAHGFLHHVRNACEGNYITYASLRGQKIVQIPETMISVFKAVKSYENYIRDLKHSLVRAYEQKSGHRPTAEHHVKQIFRKFGLPWIE